MNKDDGPDTEKIEVVKSQGSTSDQPDSSGTIPNWQQARKHPSWEDTRNQRKGTLERSAAPHIVSAPSFDEKDADQTDGVATSKKRKKRQWAKSLLQKTKQEVRISPTAYETVQKRFDATGVFYSNNRFPTEAVRKVARWASFSLIAVAVLVTWCFTIDVRPWRSQFWQENNLAVVILTTILCGAVLVCVFMTLRGFDKYRRNVTSVDKSNLTIGHPGSIFWCIKRTIKPFPTSSFIGGDVNQNWTELMMDKLPFIHQRFGSSTTTTIDFLGEKDTDRTHNMRHIRDGEELFAAVDLSSQLNHRNQPFR